MFGWFRKKSASYNINDLYTQFLSTDSSSGWTGEGYAAQAKAAYIKNVVAHYCINTIAKSVADIPYILTIGGKEQETHPILDLLRRPYPLDSYRAFMRRAIMQRLVSGNCYVLVEKLKTTGRVGELRLLRPDKVDIETIDGRLSAYTYTNDASIKKFQIDRVTLESDVIHIKDPHPLDDLRGLSPIRAAIMSIDQHNAAGENNKRLIDNGGRPAGIITLKDKDGMSAIPTDQIKKVIEDIQERISGKVNKGKVAYIPHDFQWQSMGMSPADMDWINGKNSTARDIALAFGFPPFLLGMAEGATFNNVGEAKLSLYEETVIPLLTDFLEELAWKFSSSLGKDIQLKPDLDKVSALSPRHDSYKNNIRLDLAAGIINRNEAREANAYEGIGADGDEFFVPSGQLPLNFDPKDFVNSTAETSNE